MNSHRSKRIIFTFQALFPGGSKEYKFTKRRTVSPDKAILMNNIYKIVQLGYKLLHKTIWRFTSECKYDLIWKSDIFTNGNMYTAYDVTKWK